ncbi:pyridoxal phosphate-dependent aminotransferase [Serratia marcescens]|uniref:Aminotransferase n=1 Tax=Serratia marcescens TaxID=615 RepID=A0A5C7BNV7_SERMA|nr:MULTISPECIES: pyridoxal phosphate-dependent aminotransferase [Serratia]TXE24606.1 pyridoxal phosphate-dependent aminotransferase [Serratia marcescens]TXE53329.1 pyridoxal phosphate-dependent aminotransferase [Serratia marcescens]
MDLSNRMKKIKGSSSSALAARVAELQKQGEDIISLNMGEPDFGTPDYIKIAAIKAIAEDFTCYTPSEGTLELRQAIVSKLEKDNNIKYMVDEVCTSVGVKQAIFSSLMTLCDEGDEILLPTPCWVSYTEMIHLTGAVPVFIPVKYNDNFSLDIQAIENAITHKTKAIIIGTPNNPTGAVYSEHSLRQLADLACEHDFYIISNEIYEKMIYDEATHYSIASISPEVRRRTITVNGMSKAYSMTGWRIGYAAASKEIIGAFKALQSQMTSSTCSISQKAAAVALTGDQYHLKCMIKEYDKRRLYTMSRLRAIPGITCSMPKGAFYVLPDVSAYFGRSFSNVTINNDIELARYLLETARVAVSPGENFKLPGTLRISYSRSLDSLKEAFDKIEWALRLIF